MTKHDELVEEIRVHAQKCFSMSPQQTLCHFCTEDIITLVLSAVRDGRLKLPGEVGRGQGYIDTMAWDNGTGEIEWVVEAHNVGRTGLHRDDLFQFIALSGTSQRDPVGCKEEGLEEFIMTETEAAIEGGIIDGNTGLPFEREEEADARGNDPS